MAIKPQTKTVKVSVLGAASVSFTPPARYYWTVVNISVSNNGNAVCNAFVYLNKVYICGSNNGQADTADGSSIPVPNGQTLTITWITAQHGTQCVATILVTEKQVGN